MKRILFLCMCLLFLSTKSFCDTNVVLDKIIEEDCSNLSEKLTAEVYDKNPNLVIVNEKKESDIISALSFAYKNKAAILFIQNDGAYIKKESPILKEVNRLKAKNVYIIGGPKSVSEEISDNLKLSGLLVSRIDGKNRAEVSKNVIKENTNLNPTDTLVLSDMSNFNFIQAKMGYYLKNGYAITFVSGKKFDESIIKFAINKGISNILIDQPTSMISSEYDEKLKQNGFKVTRNDYRSVYDANYAQNSNIKYSKIIFTEYKDIRTSLLASYVGLQKNYVNILVNEGNVDKTTNKLLTTSIQNGVYIGKSQENFEKLAKKLELYYKVEQK